MGKHGMQSLSWAKGTMFYAPPALLVHASGVDVT